MGRRKLYNKRLLIGLDAIQAGNLQRMCADMALTYSEAISYLLDYYQLGKTEEARCRNK